LYRGDGHQKLVRHHDVLITRAISYLPTIDVKVIKRTLHDTYTV